MKLSRWLFALTAFLTILPLAPAAPIDFTPHYLIYFVGDQAQRRLYFLDDKQKIGLRIRPNNVVDAFNGGARITCKDIVDATYLLRNSPLTDAFDPGGLPKYRELARTFVPAGVKDAQITSEVKNPLTMFDWTSYRFTSAFTVGPKKAIQEVTFLNLKPGQQIVLVATAYETDFEDFSQRCYNLIRSWNPLQASDEVPQPFN